MKFSNSIAVFAVLTPSVITAFTSSRIAQSTTSISSSSLSASRRDVLGNAFASAAGMASLIVTQEARAEPRPMYLAEPTDEFKANEAKAMEFKRAQLAIKKEFNEVIAKFLAEPNDEAAIVEDLKRLQNLVAKTGGLPLGIKKDELFKLIRSKKGKGYWPTNCEIAYQSLQGEIRFQQSPNMDKEMGNPFQ